MDVQTRCVLGDKMIGLGGRWLIVKWKNEVKGAKQLLDSGLNLDLEKVLKNASQNLPNV
jgi:hypothetical protein